MRTISLLFFIFMLTACNAKEERWYEIIGEKDSEFPLYAESIIKIDINSIEKNNNIVRYTISSRHNYKAFQLRKNISPEVWRENKTIYSRHEIDCKRELRFLVSWWTIENNIKKYMKTGYHNGPEEWHPMGDRSDEKIMEFVCK